MNYAICIPSRNRHDALLDCLKGAIRVSNSLNKKDNKRIRIFVRDNSEREYKIKDTQRLYTYINDHRDNISYVRNEITVEMDKNWNAVIDDALTYGQCEYISLIADRRMPTNNIIWAFRVAEENKLDIHVCDHQSWWISNKSLVQTRKYKEEVKVKVDTKWCMKQVYNCNFDNLTPRLYNSITSKSLLNRLKEKYGTYTGPESPDNIFQYRVAFETDVKIMVSNVPIIVSCARYASYTQSNTGIQNKTSRDRKHTKQHGTIYNLHKSFVIPKILAHLRYFIPKDEVGLYFNKFELVKQLMFEISCPNTKEQYSEMRKNLISCIKDKSLGGLGKLYNNEETKQIIKIIRGIENTEASKQIQPLMHETGPMEYEDIERLKGIEIWR